MKKQLGNLFTDGWRKYFTRAELPIAYFYADEPSADDAADSKREHRCLICNLNRVREGHAFVYNAKTPGCPGGRRYSGFSQTLRPNFEYFLSCGIPGKLEGERYKKGRPAVRSRHVRRLRPAVRSGEHAHLHDTHEPVRSDGPEHG